MFIDIALYIKNILLLILLLLLRINYSNIFILLKNNFPYLYDSELSFILYFLNKFHFLYDNFL